MPTVLTFLLRVVLFAAGLVLAAVFAAVFVLLLALWGVRLLWARLTGQAATPFVVRMGPRHAFDEVMRRARPQAPERTPRGHIADVTDVEPK